MKHYILVRWRNAGTVRQTLVNLHKIVTVVDSLQYCKIHLQGYCLDVEDSFDDVIYMIERAEAEGSRKPGDRPLMGTAARERQGEARHARWRGQWKADRDGWPYCTNCIVSADIDREEFRMKGNIRAAEPPYCPACGAIMDGKDTDVPAIPPSSDDGGGVTPYERTAPQAAPHERRRDPEGVPSGEGPEEAAEDPGG